MIDFTLTVDEILELSASIFGLLFLFLIIKEKIAAWIFGILASSINVYLLIGVKLYSESILYSFYILMGIYGWWKWSKITNGEKLKISTISLSKHFYWVIVGSVLAYGLGYYFDNYTDAERPFWDSYSTVFAFIATFLEARKVLHAWIYWIVLNTYTIFLYGSVGLNFRSIEMLIYAFFSVVGFLAWRQKMKA